MTLPQGHFLSYCLFLLSPLSLQFSWELSLMLNSSLQCLQVIWRDQSLLGKWLFFLSLLIYIVYSSCFFLRKFSFLCQNYLTGNLLSSSIPHKVYVCLCVCVCNPSFPQYKKLFFNQFIFLSYDINCLVLCRNFMHIWYSTI